MGDAGRAEQDHPPTPSIGHPGRGRWEWEAAAGGAKGAATPAGAGGCRRSCHRVRVLRPAPAERVKVRLRHSVRNPGEVTGYAVGLDSHTTADGQTVWHGGSRLAADLTLPKLRTRWASEPEP